nr:hypothetical protein [Sphingobium sp. AP50]
MTFKISTISAGLRTADQGENIFAPVGDPSRLDFGNHFRCAIFVSEMISGLIPPRIRADRYAIPLRIGHILDRIAPAQVNRPVVVFDVIPMQN